MSDIRQYGVDLGFMHGDLADFVQLLSAADDEYLAFVRDQTA
jgi:hypothetical protein